MAASLRPKEHIHCICTCFLAGALVLMADGRRIPIEHVAPGDHVMGGRGIPVTVLAIDRPKLGHRRMTLLNGTHATTDEHSHIRSNGSIGVVDVDAYMAERGVSIPVITLGGRREFWRLPELPFGWHADDFASPLRKGDAMMGANGDITLTSLERINLSPSTPLYNLITDGSHTFIINDFVVGGIVNANDFNYRAWSPIGRPWGVSDYYHSSACPQCRKPAPSLAIDRGA